MVKKDTYEALLNIFFDNPSKGFHLRELARMVHISHPAVKIYLDEIKKCDILIRTASHTYQASRSPSYSQSRRINILQRLQGLGLVSYLVKELTPRAIILFGSASRGEDVEQSDIDLFIDCPKRDLELHRYEKGLHRKINITFGDIKRLNKEFLNSVINGVILYGGIEL